VFNLLNKYFCSFAGHHFKRLVDIGDGGIEEVKGTTSVKTYNTQIIRHFYVVFHHISDTLHTDVVGGCEHCVALALQYAVNGFLASFREGAVLDLFYQDVVGKAGVHHGVAVALHAVCHVLQLDVVGNHGHTAVSL